MIQTIFEELGKNSDFYGHLLLEHIGITFTAVVIATIVGLGIGIFIAVAYRAQYLCGDYHH